MPITLKGSDGYYSREVEIDGTKFRVRELSDEELKAYMDATDELRAVLPEALQGAALADPEAVMVASLGMNSEEQFATKKARERQVDCTLAAVVKWSLDAPLTPENVLRLPDFAKVKLSRVILNESMLSEDERAPLPR